MRWHHWKTLGGEAVWEYSRSGTVLPNLTRDGEREKDRLGGEGYFDIQFPWCILGDIIARNPKLSINIHWALSPLSDHGVVKRKCEGQCMIYATNLSMIYPHPEISSLKAVFVRVFIAYSYSLYECIQRVLNWVLGGFHSVFFGPLKCQKRIDKHAVNQQTEIISYQLGPVLAALPLCKKLCRYRFPM